jgi:Leucine-rich repeat (LRR) protein
MTSWAYGEYIEWIESGSKINTEVISLDLDQSNIQNLSNLQNILNLQNLYLSYNSLTSIPESIGN